MFFLKRRPSLREIQLAIKVATLLIYFRIMLYVLKFSAVRKTIQKAEIASQANRYAVNEIIWSVLATSKRLPFMTCLVQACVTQYLFKKNGHPSNMFFGVKKSPKLKSHAWIEQNGEILLGNVEDITEYEPILIEN